MLPQRPWSPKNNRVTTRVMGERAQLEGYHRLGLQLLCLPIPQGYISYIKGLPLNDMPEIFGLHDNANITFAQNETFALLGAIIQLQPKSSSVGGHGREEVGDTGRERAQGLGRANLLPTTPPPLLWDGTLCMWNPTQGLWESALTPTISLPLQIVEDVAMNILLQVPEPINLQWVMTTYPVLYEESMNTVLIQEVIR